MKKFLQVIGVAVVSTALAACGGGEDNGDNGGAAEEGDEGETTTLSIIASNIPHAEILEEAEPLLEEEGIELDLDIADDYIFPNIALESEEVDANYFQHRPYLEDQMEENEEYDFVEAGAIHLEPMGLYSQDYDSPEDLPDGAEILMSNSVADHGRAFAILEDAGLIELSEDAGVDATEDDIVDNPKNLTFTANVEAELLPQMYNNNEAEAVMINSNYALEADLNPVEDSIAIEEGDADNPYVNLVVVRNGDENNEAIQTLVEVLQSEKIQTFIEEEYDGAVIPVTE
ncbi:MetQ/NlpA family ABC transporter substrate-binding protein [Shouchella shacheensis]|uniref:MetQ/NlpA family ABC transporter substrate-binding protein n=1 Tax=Shouchella shacheensis TaxID=1649580 RepID=UPI000740449F|nr:MetQ/NlpA family ABC transporter substrate-binding protein [Shouchella shacheensis]